MTPPTALGLDLVSARKFEYTAKGASLPASTIGKVEIPFFGRKIKVAGDREFDDWTVNLFNDEDFGVRAMFEKWSNSMNKLVSNVRGAEADLEQYKADMEVIQYAKTGEVLRSYTMVGCWPFNVGEIELDWDNTNAIETFPVTFAIDYWEPDVETSSKIAGGVNSYSGNL